MMHPKHNNKRGYSAIPRFTASHAVRVRTKSRRDSANSRERMDERTAMCSRKNSFASDVDAIHAAIVYSRELGPFNYYQCPYCGCYHLTQTIGWTDRRSA